MTRAKSDGGTRDIVDLSWPIGAILMIMFPIMFLILCHLILSILQLIILFKNFTNRSLSITLQDGFNACI